MWDKHASLFVRRISGDEKSLNDVRFFSAISGGWSSWSSWSTCNPDCVRHRRRSCNNPEPDHGGSFCKGLDHSVDVCTGGMCRGEIFLSTNELAYSKLFWEDSNPRRWVGEASFGATTLRITTLSISAFSTKGLQVTFSIMRLSLKGL